MAALAKAPVPRPIVERLVGDPTTAARVNFAQTEDPPNAGSSVEPLVIWRYP